MTAPRSFRLRIFWGALFGAFGMLVLGHILMSGGLRHTRVFRFNPRIMTEAIPIAPLLIAFGAWHVRKGLSPFDHLRARLVAMREGKEDRIEGTHFWTIGNEL